MTKNATVPATDFRLFQGMRMLCPNRLPTISADASPKHSVIKAMIPVRSRQNPSVDAMNTMP